MGSLNIYILIIIALNGIISYKGFNDYAFFEKFKFNVGAVKAGEQYRNISSGFLHADMQHLLFNMVTLFFFRTNCNSLFKWLPFYFNLCD